ncbi:MAG: agmatinase [Candidatus Micrarchaeia archaeon]
MPKKQPLNAMPKFTLFGFETSYEEAKVVALPVPYDSTSSYKSGSREGPRAIINASRFIEPFSYELGFDISKRVLVYTMDELMPDFSSPEHTINRIKKEVSIILEDKKMPLLLGGEHTISLGSLSSLKEKGFDLTVVQFDAHSDTYPELNSTKYSHASIIARAKELYSDVFQIGIRSIDEKSFKELNEERVFFAEDVRKQGAREIGQLINKKSKKNVYVTFDFDVLDPSEMPSVGTPEPNGLRFEEIVALMQEIAKGKNLAGADFVELMPIPGLDAPNYLAAKLIYLFLGYFIRGANG